MTCLNPATEHFQRLGRFLLLLLQLLLLSLTLLLLLRELLPLLESRECHRTSSQLSPVLLLQLHRGQLGPTFCPTHTTPAAGSLRHIGGGQAKGGGGVSLADQKQRRTSRDWGREYSTLNVAYKLYLLP